MQREVVISGLQHCIVQDCTECQYKELGKDCLKWLKYDALKLLEMDGRLEDDLK